MTVGNGICRCSFHRICNVYGICGLYIGTVGCGYNLSVAQEIYLISACDITATVEYRYTICDVIAYAGTFLINRE